MNNSFSESYKAAGVDITAGYKAVELMKSSIARTKTSESTPDIGGFGGLFVPDMAGMKEPVLVSGTDGVGTKIKIAFLMDKHDTVGIDCVAEGCVQAGCALIGGETAEHPGLMPAEEYDLAGFSVGIVDKEKVVDTAKQKAGDVVIALPSTGVHSNGFSLVRKVFNIDHTDLYIPIPELGGKGLGETLLTPTKIYVKPILELLKQVEVKGISHITGGGFYENIPRSIKKGLGARIKKDDVRVLPIFKLLAKEGNINEHDMFNTFNMGVGMSVIVAPENVDKAIETLKANDIDAYVIGELAEGIEGVELI